MMHLKSSRLLASAAALLLLLGSAAEAANKFKLQKLLPKDVEWDREEAIVELHPTYAVTFEGVKLQLDAESIVVYRYTRLPAVNEENVLLVRIDTEPIPGELKLRVVVMEILEEAGGWEG